MLKIVEYWIFNWICPEYSKKCKTSRGGLKLNQASHCSHLPIQKFRKPSEGVLMRMGLIIVYKTIWFILNENKKINTSLEGRGDFCLSKETCTLHIVIWSVTCLSPWWFDWRRLNNVVIDKRATLKHEDIYSIYTFCKGPRQNQPVG